MRRFAVGVVGSLVGAALIGGLALWNHSGIESDPGTYYVAIAHRSVPGRPCETLQTGVLAFNGRSTPSFTPLQVELLGRGTKPALSPADIGGYLEIPGGSDEFENRRLTTRDLAHVWQKDASLARPVEHPERGERLLEVAKNDGYDLRYTYPSKREPQNIGLDAYLPIAGHSSQECANLASAAPAQIVNSVPMIQLDQVVVTTQIPAYPGVCRIGRIASVTSTNGKVEITVRDATAQKLDIQPWEGFAMHQNVDEAVIDLQQVDPKKISLSVPTYLHPQRWEVVRINALVAYLAGKGVHIQPDDGSVDAKKMQIPDTVVITPRLYRHIV